MRSRALKWVFLISIGWGLVGTALRGQNVGIGINAPSAKLAVVGNLAVGANYAALAAPAYGAIIEGKVAVNTCVDTIYKMTVVATKHYQGGRVKADTVCEVLLDAGTGYPARVRWDSVNTPVVAMELDSSGNWLRLIPYQQNAPVNTGIVWIARQTGHVGLGTSKDTCRLTLPNPADPLDPAGRAAAAQWYVYSDARFKQNIQPLNAKSQYYQLRPIRFMWKKNPGDYHYGFIAQEVQAIVPEAAATNSVSPVQLIPVAMILLKEQTTRLDSLYAEIQNLKNALK